jgi:hypothetical protein
MERVYLSNLYANPPGLQTAIATRPRLKVSPQGDFNTVRQSVKMRAL